MSLKGDVTFHTALVSGVSHAFHVCLQPCYQGQKNEIKFGNHVVLTNSGNWVAHPPFFDDPQMFILQVTKVDSLNYSVLFGNENSNSFDTEIPPSANCIHLPISERGDSKVFILICFIWCPVWFVANAKYFCDVKFLDWSSDVAGWLVISSCNTSVWLKQKLV